MFSGNPNEWWMTVATHHSFAEAGGDGAGRRIQPHSVLYGASRTGAASLLVGDRPEGDGVAAPGERLESHALAVSSGGDHVLTALVDAYVVHVAGR